MEAKGKVVSGLASREGHRRYIEHFADKEDVKKYDIQEESSSNNKNDPMDDYIRSKQEEDSTQKDDSDEADIHNRWIHRDVKVVLKERRSLAEKSGKHEMLHRNV